MATAPASFVYGEKPESHMKPDGQRRRAHDVGHAKDQDGQRRRAREGELREEPMSREEALTHIRTLYETNKEKYEQRRR